jgi:ribosomal protein L11 methyltransferase
MTSNKGIHKFVFETVCRSAKKLTPWELENDLMGAFALSRKQARTAIQQMITDGELTYTYQYGSTYLEISFNQPVRISKQVILIPPRLNYQMKTQDIVIRLAAGASFGTGQHPTTRLAVRGIEYALLNEDHFPDQKMTTCLDVGTGSGILVIAALKFGIEMGVGIDFDPCAQAEASENVRLNQLVDRIHISGHVVHHIDRRFSVITANLRTPSLIRLCHSFSERIIENGLIILSGIKVDEVVDLLAIYAKNRFYCRWREIEHDWAGIVLKKDF